MALLIPALSALYFLVEPSTSDGIVLFLGIFFAQSAVWLFLLLGPPARLPLLWIAAIVAIAVTRLTPPLFENDFYLYFWDAAQTWEQGTPYGPPPAEVKLPAGSPLTAIRDQLGFPHHPTIYPPLAQLLFLGTYLLSWKNLAIFLWVLALGGLAAFAFSYQRLLARKRKPSTFLPLILLHPLILKEWVQSVHYDSYLAAGLAFTLSASPLTRGFAAGILTQLKATGALAFFLEKNWRGVFPFLIGLTLPWVFFLKGLPDYLSAMSSFGGTWEMNTGVYRLVQFLFQMITHEPAASEYARFACFGLFGFVLILVLRASLSLPEKMFWAYFIAVWLSPVVNAWYFTWSLPLVVFLPRSVQPWAVLPFSLTAFSYCFFLPIQNFELYWNFEHLAIFGCLYLAWRNYRNEARR